MLAKKLYLVYKFNHLKGFNYYQELLIDFVVWSLTFAAN